MIISYFIEMIRRDDVYKGAYQACCISFVVERNYFPKTSFFHRISMLHCCGNQ